ncbi:type II toxin-antitoxin system HicB family antitoxin [Candidatus Nitrosotenuis aquarius]|uniref:type II toxin-antitoxin system HicB family antitoxin n=1 Tax=Candidatus Nitrosotenuis aquarius TaxID=1846278 RepID=UPI000C1F37BD|nr:type II toxin-antitoxin system HicB family antitoxin [Candidatus Nitrosotenuis aquarius]
MSVKIKDIQTRMIKEDDGSYSITCSALGVYSSGKTKQDAKKNFVEALELHLSVLREKATKVITA